MITIKHTHEDGTLIYGTRKGDGVYEIVKKWENGNFRYFPSMARQGLPCIGLRHSRDQVADRWAINAAAKALRAAGFEVTVEIDDTPRDRAQVLEDKAERLEDRRDALETKANRHASAAAAAHDRADQISERFAGGQPKILGHHSQRRYEADQKRMHAAMGKSVREDKTAQEIAGRASAVGANMRYSAKPSVTKRRIDNAVNEIKRIDRDLAGYTRRHLDHHGNPYFIDKHEPASGDHRERLIARRAQLEDQLEYDRAQLELAKAAGWIEWGPDNVHVGDLVEYWVRGRKRSVLKVNKKTVAVESGYSWPDKVEFSKILSVECPHEDMSVPAAEPPSAVSVTTPPPSPAPAPRKVQVAKVNVDELTAKIAAAILEVPRDSDAFFSPPAVVERVLDAAELEPSMIVLEPSAGNGALAKAAAAEGCEVHCVERYPVLSQNLLDVAGIIGLTTGDFLEVTPDQYPAKFDRVLMNPPFSKGQDIQHVMHALRFLKPGGLLAAVMSSGVTHRQDKHTLAFCDLVWKRGGHIAPLPDNAFATSGTDVRTVLVLIPAPEE
ncbi:DUF3560 domain-containing protein [Nonomuraea sp. NPDC052116]|uniref:DUF3560 domain-containing protein n=1 Tax=Nonomuraea sp. NPDC052116 TaxID=3155665 RepID=UPI00343040A7